MEPQPRAKLAQRRTFNMLPSNATTLGKFDSAQAKFVVIAFKPARMHAVHEMKGVYFGKKYRHC